MSDLRRDFPGGKGHGGPLIVSRDGEPAGTVGGGGPIISHPVIYKYPVPFVVGRAIPLELPREAKILSVQVQGEALCLWAIVDPSLPTEVETIRIIPTGQPIDPTLAVMIDHLATIQIDPFVWHVFKGG